jgi:hypothetical protein
MSLALYGRRDLATPEIERRFFTRLRLPNGTYKTTYRHRLDDVNELLLGLLPRDRDLDLMDVAISSGFATIEWSDHLTTHGIAHRLVAGDLLTDATLTNFGDHLALLFDDGGQHPLLLELGRVSVPVWSDLRLARLVRPVLFPALRGIAAVGRGASTAVSDGSKRSTRWSHRSVPLVTTELTRRPEIKLVQDDIMQPGRFAHAFDVIRVANLVQRVYFEDPTLQTMLNNLRNRLRDGGLLVICRTMDDGVNHATVFRLTGDRFSAEVSLNHGAEVGDLVLAL